MFYTISKLLTIFLSPVLFMFILIIWSYFSKKKKIFFISMLSFFYFFTSPLILNFFSDFIEEEASKIAKIGKFNYGILLGGIASFDSNTKQIKYSNNITRLLSTLELYKSGKIDTIFISAGNKDTSELELIESVFLKKQLQLYGVPEEKILIEYQSANTHQNAVFSAQKLKPKEKKATYLLITSSYHIKRARACFQKEGFEIESFAADQLGNEPKLTINQLIPSASQLYKWDYILHELVGIVSYKLIGYL